MEEQSLCICFHVLGDFIYFLFIKAIIVHNGSFCTCFFISITWFKSPTICLFALIVLYQYVLLFTFPCAFVFLSLPYPLIASLLYCVHLYCVYRVTASVKSLLKHLLLEVLLFNFSFTSYFFNIWICIYARPLVNTEYTYLLHLLQHFRKTRHG